jgi:hypothetical protein
MVAGIKSSVTLYSLSPKIGPDFLHGKSFCPLFLRDKLWYTDIKFLRWGE